jgi:hypothetical protein
MAHNLVSRFPLKGGFQEILSSGDGVGGLGLLYILGLAPLALGLGFFLERNIDFIDHKITLSLQIISRMQSGVTPGHTK